MTIGDSAVIETRDLSKHFKEVKAVEGLNMKVQKGEIFGFLGPNGAGKTTTIKMIMGLIRPTQGEVLVNGSEVGINTVEIRQNIGFLPERVSFYENLTPAQTLNFFCELKGENKSCIEPIIEEVGLEEAANRKMGTLSKGMVQLVGVAQAMIGNPSIYILDEPMGGLDARWVKVVREKIRMVNDKGATIIFSSHILSEVQNLCDRVAIIDKGRLVAEGTITNISELLNIRPRLVIMIPGLNGKVPRVMEAMEGVEHTEARGEELWVTCDSSLRVKVISVLEDEGLKIEDIRTIEPSLEDAFVKLVSGRGGG